MRVTTLVRRMLGVTELIVDASSFEQEGLVVAVRPRGRVPHCRSCGKRAAGYDRRPTRRWRHLGIGKLKLWLEYAPRRVEGRRRGGVLIEPVPRAAHRSRSTWDFNNQLE